MPQYFQRPENALKRANEFIDVGKKQRALDALCDVIKSRKHRTWQKIHEPIMTKYLGLCVELKKSHVAKEGLFQYRNICQQVNIKSLEDVVRGYLALAEEKTESAREESQQVVVDIDDLDQVQTPESLLLSAVSSEDTQDRTDRVVLTPWVKFLWESYRHCLELLRNNSRVERLYHDIAHYAFRFCLKYNRKTEFRKLCDNLRAHLGHIHKHQNQQTSVNLNNPDSQAMHLETRLVQLDSAIQMELWQEAYKAIEDIHGLMSLSKKTPNPRLMANYYQKLALVFWKSNNLLFHAAALFRLFYLSREQKKNITADEISKMASRVVLATLAVPMTPIRSDIDRLVETDENVIDKNQRLLSTLLGLSNPPTRAILIKDLVRFGIIQSAPPQLQDLYRWLETDFHPLKLCGRVQQAFEFFNKSDEFPELRQYIPSIQDITVVRLVKEVSQVYQTIQFCRLLELAPFIQPFDLEYLVVDIARRNDLQVRIDHRKNCFHFGSELNVSQREEIIEGPQLQSMPSEQMRNQLVFIHSVLNKAVNFLLPVKKKLERKELSKEILKAYMHTSSKDHMRILNRQQIIEERKEMLENLNYQKEAKERKILEDKHQKLRDAEKERMAKETEERSKQRLLREQSEMKRKVVLEKIEQLKKTEIFTKMLEGMDELELEKLDPDELLTKQVEQMDKERKELQAKLKTQERKVDHLERAKRIVEIPLLLAENEECQKNDKQFWEQHEKERITTIIEERAMSVQYRDRLLRLKDDRDKFLEQLKKARGSVYEEKLTEFEKLVNEERKKRLKERKEARKEDRKVQRLKLQEEKKQQMIAEAMKREREEALAKLEEMEAKKRAKEKEIEERLKQEKLELKAPISKEDDRDSRSYPDSQRDNDHSDGRDRGVGGSSYSRDRDSYRRDDSSDRRGRDRDGYSSRNESSSKASEGSWRSGGGGSWRDSGKNDKVEDRSAKERDSYSSRNEGSGGYRSRNDGPSSYSSRGDGPSSFSSRGDGAGSYSSRRDGGSGFGSRNESSDKPSESSWRSGGGGSSTGGSWRDSGRRDNEDRSDRKPPASRGDSYRRDGARRDNEEAGKEREGYSSRNVGSGGYRSRNDGPSNYSSRGDGSGGFGSRNENSDKAPEGGSWRSGGGNTGGSWRDSGRRDNEDRSDRKPPPRGDTYRRDKPRDTDDDGFVQVKR